MSPSASGLERDLSLVRRRGWLFVPFLLVGLVLAFLLGTGRGDFTATAAMQLETMVNGLSPGTDLGLRVFEAQSMTGDEAFRQSVRDAVGGRDFDFRRYRIVMSEASVAEGLSRATLTVSITDAQPGEAERLRNAFVDVFIKEYQEPDGLFRTRYIGKLKGVVETAEQEFKGKYEELQELAQELGLGEYEQLIGGADRTGPSDDLSEQMAILNRQLAEVEGALNAITAATPAGAAVAIASSTLGQPVEAADAVAALGGKRAALIEALRLLNDQQIRLNDPDLVRLVDEVRAFGALREDGHERLANATVAVVSTDTTAAVSQSVSGGPQGSTMERVAVTLAVTVVFGLIAIYLLEWFSQIRAGVED